MQFLKMAHKKLLILECAGSSRVVVTLTVAHTGVYGSYTYIESGTYMEVTCLVKRIKATHGIKVQLLKPETANNKYVSCEVN